MKTIIATLLFIASTTTWAHSNNALAEEMKLVETHFKQIASSLQGGVITLADIEASESLQKSIATAAQLYPTTATDDSLKVQYSQWMAELMDLSLDLEASLEEEVEKMDQNLTPSVEIFTLMNELRKKGHDAFKESH